LNCSVLISLSSSKRKLSYFNSKYFNFNIFNPESADPEVHAERVFQIFKSGAKYEDIEYSPQMERVFVETLKRVCKDPAKRNWEAFRKELKDYADEVVSDTGDYTYKNSRTAVENRIRRYSLGTLKHCFDIKTGLDIRKLFNHNVLLDVSGVLKLGGEKEDALFFLNMLLKYLYDENIERGSRNYKGIRHVTIIEDEQYFASAQTSKKSTISSYIEDIALLLRGTGECLISLATRPAVSAEILANCGIFISFRENMQRDLLEDLLNLKNYEGDVLSLLDVGTCLIRTSSTGKPFYIKSELVKREWLDFEEIEKNNSRILEKIGIGEVNVDNNRNYSVDSLEDLSFYCNFCGNLLYEDAVKCDLCGRGYNKT